MSFANVNKPQVIGPYTSSVDERFPIERRPAEMEIIRACCGLGMPAIAINTPF